MLCCVCLLESPDLKQLFDEMGHGIGNVAEIIRQHLWLTPQPKDNLGSHICGVCWTTLSDFHEFYKQAEKIHAEYQLTKNTLSIKEEEVIQMPTTSNSIKLENDEDLYGSNLVPVEVQIDTKPKRKRAVKNERKHKNTLQTELETEMDGTQEADDYLMYDEQQCNPLDNLDPCEYMDVEMESEDSDDFIPSEIYDDESNSDDDDLNTDMQSKEIQDDNAVTSRKRKSSKVSKATMDDVKKKRKSQYKLDQTHTEEMILKHIPMGCNLCVFVGKTFPDIVEHFRTYHPKIRAYITCCDKKFTKRFYIAQHALKHEDPNCFKCEECNKIFTTTCGLKTHNLAYHAPEEELTFVCDLCPKKFAKQNFLEMHKTSHIPRELWSFHCTKCQPSKTFASQYLLNVHTSMQHKRAKHVCHVCAKEIRDKHSFEKHVRLHFEESGPRVPCPYPDCDSWLKDQDNLKQHLKRHNPEGIIYKCPECNKVVKNRRALTNHKRYSHSNETFQCEQCDKTFKKAISLREHMTQHTGETLYKCPFCDRTFNSNANMHAHKKRQHPIEWEEWRRNKTGSSQVLIKNLNSF